MKKIKNILKKIPIVNSLLRYVIRKFKRDDASVSYWIRKLISNRDIQVLQIGSNDGISGDPLHQLIIENKKWNVLFVEPIPQLFEKLKKNYGNEERFKFENSGINKDGSRQKFFYYGDKAFHKFPDLSQDFTQIGSFSKNQIEKFSTKELLEYIEEMEVNCMNLETLLNTHKIESLNLIQIDAEGYDWKILSQLNLKKYHPEVIVFESVNLEEEEKKEAFNYLNENYFMFSMRIDYLCIRKDRLKIKEQKALASRLVKA